MMVCPACGDDNIEQVDFNEYECSSCGWWGPAEELELY